MTEVWAGFECARFEKWDYQDLLEQTRHTPETDMTEHYQVAQAHGVRTVRDGLPWHKHIGDRFNAVPDGMDVWWDLVHFDPSPNLNDHVKQVWSLEAALYDTKKESVKICLINEPSIWPLLTPYDRKGAIGLGGDLIRWCRNILDQRIEFMTCDPIHHMHPDELYATKRLCEHGIDLIGINYYPHETQIPLREILQWMQSEFPDHRFTLSETSWHIGWEQLRRNWPSIRSQAGWLIYLMNEIAASGVDVEGICWYPWIDTPGWGDKQHETWVTGMVDLIR